MLKILSEKYEQDNKWYEFMTFQYDTLDLLPSEFIVYIFDYIRPGIVYAILRQLFNEWMIGPIIDWPEKYYRWSSYNHHHRSNEVQWGWGC